MQKILVSLPDDLTERMKSLIPHRQRSMVIAKLLIGEVEKREMALYQCACEVEKDADLNREMNDWNTTTSDGIEHETW